MKGVISVNNENELTTSPNYVNPQMYNQPNMYYNVCPYQYYGSFPMYSAGSPQQFQNTYILLTGGTEEARPIAFKDYGPEPFIVNIEEAAEQNSAFRRALWTGKHLQLTLMSIRVGEDIGVEIHPNLDQFIRIEEGFGLVKMGDKKDRLDFQRYVNEDYAFIIPAGKWHNLINVGNKPLKLYSIYAPPQHKHGTVHETKADAMAAE